LEDIYNEIYFHFIIKFNKFYKSVQNNSKDYVLIPIGSYSSLTLDTQYINIDLLNNYDINSLNIENNKINENIDLILPYTDTDTNNKIFKNKHDNCCIIF
jgi:hypothetical protein